MQLSSLATTREDMYWQYVIWKSHLLPIPTSQLPNRRLNPARRGSHRNAQTPTNSFIKPFQWWATFQQNSWIFPLEQFRLKKHWLVNRCLCPKFLKQHRETVCWLWSLPRAHISLDNFAQPSRITEAVFIWEKLVDELTVIYTASKQTHGSSY